MKSYDPAAGVVVLKFKDGDWNVLFLKTKKGKYDLTKGIIDVNESSFDAAVRETYEEAGIDELDFGQFGKSAQAAMFWLGAGEDHPQLHNPDYDFPDEIIETATSIFHQVVSNLQH